MGAMNNHLKQLLAQCAAKWLSDGYNGHPFASSRFKSVSNVSIIANVFLIYLMYNRGMCAVGGQYRPPTFHNTAKNNVCLISATASVEYLK